MEIHQFEAPEQVRAYSEFRQCPPPDLLRIVLAYLGEEVSYFLSLFSLQSLQVKCGIAETKSVVRWLVKKEWKWNYYS